jgi:hypothetical protein
MPTERRFVDALAEKTLGLLVRRAIVCLQRMKECRMSGDDSGLANVWDEVCVQVQFQESHSWDAYDDTVHQIVQRDLGLLNRLELESVWFQTDRGWEWWDDSEEEQSSPEAASQPAPVDLDAVMELVVGRVYDQAANWSNRRIRTYLASPDEMDD